jgi:hypothetical protein
VVQQGEEKRVTGFIYFSPFLYIIYLGLQLLALSLHTSHYSCGAVMATQQTTTTESSSSLQCSLLQHTQALLLILGSCSYFADTLNFWEEYQKLFSYIPHLLHGQITRQHQHTSVFKGYMSSHNYIYGKCNLKRSFSPFGSNVVTCQALTVLLLMD